MSHFSGEYSYAFVRVEPSWCDSAQTGIENLVVGLTCTFSGVDSQDVPNITSKYIDGTTGFMPCITYDYLTGNIDTICNDYATAQNWWSVLETQVSGSIDHTVPVTGFNQVVPTNPPV